MRQQKKTLKNLESESDDQLNSLQNAAIKALSALRARCPA